jgi:hypothetical protein
MMEKYDFSFMKWKVIFSDQKKKELKWFRKSIFSSIFNARVREILSMPFIYSMIVPAVIFDVFLFIYQHTAIRLYGIPLAKRGDYIVFDRKHLAYLNLIQKINCLYCSYVNGLLSYWVEIAGRTEKYWCPIKSAARKKWWHDWEEYFADYGDPIWFKEEFTSTECFKSHKKDS